MHKLKELTKDGLMQVTGRVLFPTFVQKGIKYSREPNGAFNIWDIVEDIAGIQYQILYFAGYENGTNWYFAEVVYVPENEFSANLKDTK